MLFVLCFLLTRNTDTVTEQGVNMPAIASLEDLKAAQKEGVSIYAMLYALCSMLYGNGAG